MATDEPRPTHKSQPSTATIVPLEIQVPDHANEYQELEPNSILFESSPLSAVTPTPLTLHQTLISTSTSNALDLDALLSPTITDSETQSIRESVAASDIADEERFSTVLLTSARQSLDSPEGVTADVGSSTSVISDENSTGDLQDTNVLSGDDLVRLVHTSRAHKKTASTSTIMSSNNVNFFLGRLEAQEEDRSRPQSIDGQQKLQEEFSKMQSDQDRQTQETSANLIDWDFWGDVVSDYQKFAEEHPDELAKAIEKGIPKSLRGMIWQLMSASKDPDLEQTYLRLLKETSPHEKAISRDLGRTFPHHAFFNNGQGIGQENLFNVLKAYSIYDPQVGYCQGLPFVVAILLLHMPDEEAFCLLVRLMHSYGLRGHFLPEMPKLQLRLFQFDRLIEEILPVLYLHFVRQGIKSSMYCSQWFLTIFSYRFPLDIVFRIFDNCLASGIEAMFAFSLMLLHKNEETLLSMQFDKLLNFLNTKVFEVYQLETEGDVPEDPKARQYDVNQFVQDAVSLRITPFMLDTYAHEYDEMIKKQNAHAIEVDALRTSNRNLSTQVNTLEASLAQLNSEHCEVLNELVRSRLRNEELESELVRYKLLYAEAMHQNEDAMSSNRLSANLSRRGSGQSAYG